MQILLIDFSTFEQRTSGKSSCRCRLPNKFTICIKDQKAKAKLHMANEISFKKISEHHYAKTNRRSRKKLSLFELTDQF